MNPSTMSVHLRMTAWSLILGAVISPHVSRVSGFAQGRATEPHHASFEGPMMIKFNDDLDKEDRQELIESTISDDRFFSAEDRDLLRMNQKNDSPLQKAKQKKERLMKSWDEQEKQTLACGFDVNGYGFILDPSKGEVTSTSVSFGHEYDKEGISARLGGTLTTELASRNVIVQFDMTRARDYKMHVKALREFLNDLEKGVKVEHALMRVLLALWEQSGAKEFRFKLLADSTGRKYSPVIPKVYDPRIRPLYPTMYFGKYLQRRSVWVEGNNLHIRYGGQINFPPTDEGRLLGEVEGTEAFPFREVNLENFFGTQPAKDIWRDQHADFEAITSIGYAVVHNRGFMPNQEFVVVNSSKSVLGSMIVDESGLGYLVIEKGYYIYAGERMFSLPLHEEEIAELGDGAVQWVSRNAFDVLMNDIANVLNRGGSGTLSTEKRLGNIREKLTADFLARGIPFKTDRTR